MWGKEFTDLFLNTSLPSQLSTLNLGSTHSNHEITYKIYTTPEDANDIQKHPHFQKLSRTIKTKILTPQIPNKSGKYLMMSDFHRLALKEASRENIPMIFIAPDLFFSEGTFSAIIKLIEKGQRVLYIPTLRLNKPSFISAMQPKLMDLYQHGNTFSPRELVKLAMNHFHPVTKADFWEKDTISKWPSQIGWRLDDHSMMVRGFHLSAILIWPENNTPLTGTVDGKFLSKACPSNDKHTIVTDSDDFIIFEMSPPPDPHWNQSCKKSLWRISNWALVHTNPSHHTLLERKCYIHWTGRTDQWKKIEEQSDQVINHILSKIRKPSLFMRSTSFFTKIIHYLKYYLKLI